MKQITGELWGYAGKPGYVPCITTNGTIKADGTCVMGRGCAKQCVQIYPMVPKILGDWIKREGNVVGYFILPDKQPLVTFPVKHNWWEVSDVELIKASAEQMKYLANMADSPTFILPKPGCGNGKLKWEEVKPLLEILPDSVWVIDYE